MALSEESKDLLQAQVELWNQSFGFMKSVALAVALDLRIADTIRHHGGAATLPQILSGIGINPSTGNLVRRARRACLQADDSVLPPHERRRRREHGELLVPYVEPRAQPFHDSVLSMGLAAWFRHEEPGKCPYALMRGATVWEMCGSSDALNASINNAMAADSRFLMRIVLEEYGETIFRGVDSLVDVAGGVGGAAAAITAAFPSLKCSVQDLPHVVAKAPSVSNVQFVAGDMFESIPPANAVFLKYVLHDWGDDKCIKLLKDCKQAIPSRDAGGKLDIGRHTLSF
ncbi:5-pentadecatrienyl resorcinol O-methyltransferase-like [Panicum miliaceum]|uniref:5-pentadecatrienyl resorcinol O-methyltransferase-like n=1 Tax=Panicum miliaceum TaxID=4540 RepID=A0A3L6SI98_PANMI|nr:5-pentadecatrienyl resorcinol O-methyltransferase-like [Panicum miliaceum]